MASTEEAAIAASGADDISPTLFDKAEPSERLMNAFVLVFLVVLALCMILSHQMGHKFKVRRCVRPWSSRQIPSPTTFTNPHGQFKYLAEAGAVVIVGMLLGGVVMLSSHGRAQEWLSHSISPTVFFIGACLLDPVYAYT